MIARFDAERRETVAERVRALPNLETASYRYERLNAPLTANGHHMHQGAINTVGAGRRGYEILEGRDVATDRAGEAVIEQGLAKEWDLRARRPRSDVGRETGTLTIVGIASAPDNVAFPLATTARVYISEATIRERLGFTPDAANVALLWLRDPSKADVTLTQARAVSFGLGKLEFVTREGVRVLLSQAAGIVISLLVAFSLVALVAAGTMLAAGAHADVQRRLSAFGVQRALGFTPARIAALQAAEATLVAVPGRARRAGDRHARRGRAVGRAARRPQRAPAGRRPARAAGARLPRRGGDRRRGRDLARVAGGAPAAGGDPARRRRDGARRQGGAAAACSGSARASRPRRAGASWRRWRRSPSARAWSC